MLIYSELFGLREVKGYPMKLYQGMYSRGAGKDSEWSVSVLRKNHHGRNICIEWVRVHRSKLPAKLKTEALLLGVTC